MGDVRPDRGVAHDSAVQLTQRVRTAPREVAEQLVDCEFSFARRVDDAFVIEHSTLPWREGLLLFVDTEVQS